ncbi:MAG TPA: DM13 domain-containing protein [Ignavibacteriaceae bacterium]|jgi:hypothetical protein
MKTGIILIFIIGLIIGGGIAWYLISPAFIVIEMDEELPGDTGMTSQEMSLLSGDFIPSAHEVSGMALVIDENGKKILRFENFETVNGPNLHIYLATDLSVTDYIDLGEIRATKGNVNYEIPDGIDLEKYNVVVIWCVPFKVLFSYAELSDFEDVVQEESAKIPEVKEFTILADDYGFYIDGEDLNSISVNSGGNVKINFNVDSERVYYAGLDFKGCGIDTGKINPGNSVIVEFVPTSNCVITSYWPSSSVIKDRLNVVVS